MGFELSEGPVNALVAMVDSRNRIPEKLTVKRESQGAARARVLRGGEMEPAT
jgi:hypothetical protein